MTLPATARTWPLWLAQTAELVSAAQGVGPVLVSVVVILLTVGLLWKLVGQSAAKAFGQATGDRIADRIIRELKEKKR